MSLYTIRTGAPLHPEDTVLEHLTDMVRKGGVLNPETDLLTVEPSGGGLNVDVEIGRVGGKGLINGAKTRKAGIGYFQGLAARRVIARRLCPGWRRHSNHVRPYRNNGHLRGRTNIRCDMRAVQPKSKHTVIGQSQRTD